MKRILSVILSVVLIMNIFTVLASASAVKSNASNESIRFIRAIDIMTKYTDADFEAGEKKIYIPDTVSVSEFKNSLSIPEGASAVMYADRTFASEMSESAYITDGNVFVVTSENGKAVRYYDVAIGGLGMEELTLEDNGDGTWTAYSAAWYTLKEGESEQPGGLLIIAVYNDDGSLSHLITDSDTIASGDGTEFEATTNVSAGQKVKAFFWNSFKAGVPYCTNADSE